MRELYQFDLRRHNNGAMSCSMVLRIILMAMISSCFVSCKSSSDTISVTETRRLTQSDEPRAALIPVMPPEWRQVPSTQMRAFNYRFGVDGEVYISNSRGGVLPNVNRWLKQYGKPEVASVDSFTKVKVLDREGVLVETTGRFGGGMGKPPRENAGLLGAMADFGGSLLTVKMIGSAESVAAERARFLKFCETLKQRETVAPAH